MTKQAQSQDTQSKLRQEMADQLKASLETAKLYELAPNETLKEITDAVLKNANTGEAVKIAISEHHHRYYAFSYPSDGLNIKAYISVPQDLSKPIPLIIFLRAGNRMFYLPHPNELSAQPGFAVVATTHRGGVSDGEDEFGGDDVNDVKDLMEFLPLLAEKLQIQFHPTDVYMVGISRGAMELFLALGRYPQLQTKIKKIASITGLVNMTHAMKDRLDFKQAMLNNFGYTEDAKGEQWLQWRLPINYVDKLSTNLPILLVQGTQDTRVCLQEGYDMLEALRATGHQVTYIEIEGAEHLLVNKPEFIHTLFEWLKN